MTCRRRASFRCHYWSKLPHANEIVFLPKSYFQQHRAVLRQPSPRTLFINVAKQIGTGKDFQRCHLAIVETASTVQFTVGFAPRFTWWSTAILCVYLRLLSGSMCTTSTLSYCWLSSPEQSPVFSAICPNLFIKFLLNLYPASALRPAVSFFRKIHLTLWL